VTLAAVAATVAIAVVNATAVAMGVIAAVAIDKRKGGLDYSF